MAHHVSLVTQFSNLCGVTSGFRPGFPPPFVGQLPPFDDSAFPPSLFLFSTGYFPAMTCSLARAVRIFGGWPRRPSETRREEGFPSSVSRRALFADAALR